MRKIKAYVRVDEHNKIKFYRNFTVESGLYEVGDLYDHETIKEITEIKPDIENNSEVFNYNYFRLITTMNGDYSIEDGDYLEYFIAIEKEN